MTDAILVIGALEGQCYGYMVTEGRYPQPVVDFFLLL